MLCVSAAVVVDAFVLGMLLAEDPELAMGLLGACWVLDKWSFLRIFCADIE